MLRCLRLFWLGFGGQHVTYNERRARCYDAGWLTSCTIYISIPFVACFALGAAFGAWMW